MSSGEAADFESLLRQALAPVDPPVDLAERLESTLGNLTELATEELESGELASMRDPRNWVRPAAAVVVGGAAGTALVILRMRQQRRATETQRLQKVLGQAMDDVAAEARKIFDR